MNKDQCAFFALGFIRFTGLFKLMSSKADYFPNGHECYKRND